MNNIITILCIIGGLVLLLSLLPKNSNFLDVRSIFAQHFNVFRGNWLQFFGIFIVPILFSIGIVQIRCVDKEILNNLNIVLSILIAMFFSVLSILSAIDGQIRRNEYQQLLTETFTTTIFEIILCLLLLLISFIVLFIGVFEKTVILKIISGIIYYLTIVTILNILVIIKRIKVLFDNK